MDVAITLGLIIVFLALLLISSDWLIDSAEKVGLSLGISPFIIGVTIVAFGTSLPELVTSISSVLQGESEIVVGNVVGSNITNIALVLGLVTVVTNGIRLDYNVWNIDMPYLWGSAFMLYFVILDLRVSLFESILLFLGIVIFLLYSGLSDNSEEEVVKVHTSWKTYVMLLIGAAGVWIGATYTISNISRLSELLGISSEIFSLSVIALGTSLPEVIVSLSAARKGKASIAVGNVLGSNIFNTFFVMGLPSLIGELEIPVSMKTTFIPMMIVLTILFGVMSNNRHITRWEGAFLLMLYLLYASFLFDTGGI